MPWSVGHGVVDALESEPFVDPDCCPVVTIHLEDQFVMAVCGTGRDDVLAELRPESPVLAILVNEDHEFRVGGVTGDVSRMPADVTVVRRDDVTTVLRDAVEPGLETRVVNGRESLGAFTRVEITVHLT